VLLALSCLGVFSADAYHLSRSSPNAERRQLFHDYWVAHPYLIPPNDLASQLPPGEIAMAEAEQVRRRQARQLPDDATLEAERTEWLAPTSIGLLDAWQYRWGLVPSHGGLQVGWFTHLFMHATWWHLLGNLFFFALVAPAVEQLVGPFAFLLLYLVAGVVAAACQYMVDMSSAIPVVGASGAIAGCMGAFTVCFRRERFLLPWGRRAMEIPAWLWGAVWISEQLLLLLGGVGGQGIAVLAHVGGYAFGAAAAAGRSLGGRPTRVG
jgi:membrane associated rhomboid family serine protease